MASFEDFNFISSTGCNSIHVRMCKPTGEVRGVVQIAHGISEYINRYDEFMSFLADNGFVVVGNDHLGHGASIADGSTRGFFAEENGWFYVVDDMKKLHDQIHAQYPNVPYIFFGHSMGSFLTRTYLIKYPEDAAAAVISGTGHQGGALVKAGLAITSAVGKTAGKRYCSKLINSVCFGAYNSGFENPKTPFDWLSRNEENVWKYINDPLCGFICTASLYHDMMTGIQFITDKENIAKMKKSTPIYFMSGAADPVGENGKGVERAYKAFCDAGMMDLMIRLYPEGRHEMLNELNKDDVYKDILNWISSKI